MFRMCDWISIEFEFSIQPKDEERVKGEEDDGC